MLFEVENYSGHSGLGFGDADLLQQRIAYRNYIHTLLIHFGASAADVEEQPVGLSEPIRFVVKIRGDFDGNAGNVAERPVAYRGYLTRNGSGTKKRGAKAHYRHEHGAAGEHAARFGRCAT